jgi:hypothetical protein
VAAADGGTMRLSQRKGNYQITVFTTPTPVRVGPVDISVLVQDAATGEPAPDLQVMIKATHGGPMGMTLCHAATTDAATNKLFHAAIFELPEPGEWNVEVSIGGSLGKAQVHFELESAEPMPRWLTLWPWIGWPVIAIMLFGIHQVLVKGRPDQRTRNQNPCRSTRNETA